MRLRGAGDSEARSVAIVMSGSEGGGGSVQIRQNRGASEVGPQGIQNSCMRSSTKHSTGFRVV